MLAYINGSCTPFNYVSSTYYTALATATGFVTVENTSYQPIPHALILDQLMVNFDLTAFPALGTGNSITFTIMKNSVATELSVTIADSASFAIDNSHSVSFSAGDLVSLRAVYTGTLPKTIPRSSWAVRQSASGLFAVLSGSGVHNDSPSVAWFQAQANESPQPTEAEFQSPVPLAGTVKNMYVVFDSAPTGTWTTDFRKNGASAGPSVAISGSNVTGNDTTNTTHLTAGDLIALKFYSASSPSGVYMNCSFSVAPDTDGQSFQIAAQDDTGMPNNATGYCQTLGDDPWHSNEVGSAQVVYGAVTYEAFYFHLTVAPGTGKSWTFTLRNNTADTAATVTISDANTTANITGQSVATSAGDLQDVSSVPSNTPAKPLTSWGLMMYIPTPAVASSGFLSFM